MDAKKLGEGNMQQANDSNIYFKKIAINQKQFLMYSFNFQVRMALTSGTSISQQPMGRRSSLTLSCWRMITLETSGGREVGTRMMLTASPMTTWWIPTTSWAEHRPGRWRPGTGSGPVIKSSWEKMRRGNYIIRHLLGCQDPNSHLFIIISFFSIIEDFFRF